MFIKLDRFLATNSFLLSLHMLGWLSHAGIMCYLFSVYECSICMWIFKKEVRKLSWKTINLFYFSLIYNGQTLIINVINDTNPNILSLGTFYFCYIAFFLHL